MATTSKSNIWAQVEAVLVSSKVKVSVIDELKCILAPKSGGSGISNPSHEVDGVMMHYCRFHQRFEAECDMVMSMGKSKGYCKASISKWNKMSSDIKKLESNAIGFMTRDDSDKAKELSLQANEMKAKLNLPESYDYDQDWANFNA